MLTSSLLPRVLTWDRHLALELLGNRPTVFHQGHLTLHRGVEEQQAVQDVAGGEDLFCILNIHTTQLLNVHMRARVLRGCVVPLGGMGQSVPCCCR